jgi:hypothetical protein
VILAAILLKMGGYGFLRFSLPMFPHASMDLAPLIFTLSVIAIVYTSLVALVQEDMKKLIAYSSVAHMGFVTMGIFALTTQGIAGGIFQMISHGLVSAALFLCVGVVYDRLHTARDLGLWRAREQHADLRLRVHDLHARQCRAARHLRLHRRVPDADRHVPHQSSGREPGDDRGHPSRLLCALALSQGRVRRDRQAGVAAMREHGAPRNPRIRAGGGW